jgi:hypothetical protein
MGLNDDSSLGWHRESSGLRESIAREGDRSALLILVLSKDLTPLAASIDAYGS